MGKRSFHSLPSGLQEAIRNSDYATRCRWARKAAKTRAANKARADALAERKAAEEEVLEEIRRLSSAREYAELRHSTNEDIYPID